MTDGTDPFERDLTERMRRAAATVRGDGVVLDQAVAGRPGSRARAAMAVGAAAALVLVGGAVAMAARDDGGEPVRAGAPTSTTEPCPTTTTTTVPSTTTSLVGGPLGAPVPPEGAVAFILLKRDQVNALEGAGLLTDEQRTAASEAVFTWITGEQRDLLVEQQLLAPSVGTTTTVPATDQGDPPTVLPGSEGYRCVEILEAPTTTTTEPSTTTTAVPGQMPERFGFVEGGEAWAVVVDVVGLEGPDPEPGHSRVSDVEDRMFEASDRIGEAGAYPEQQPLACDEYLGVVPTSNNGGTELWTLGAYFSSEAEAIAFRDRIHAQGGPVDTLVTQVRTGCVDEPVTGPFGQFQRG